MAGGLEAGNLLHLHLIGAYTDPPPTEFRREAKRRVDNMELRVQFDRRKLTAGTWSAVCRNSYRPPNEREPVGLDTDRALERYITSVGDRWWVLSGNGDALLGNRVPSRQTIPLTFP